MPPRIIARARVIAKTMLLPSECATRKDWGEDEERDVHDEAAADNGEMQCCDEDDDEAKDEDGEDAHDVNAASADGRSLVGL